MAQCLYCKNPFPKRRRKYCSDNCGERYFEEYIRPLWWPHARTMALRRAGGCCEICGEPAVEVHHIDPLLGEPRFANAKNRQENLQAVCLKHNPRGIIKASTIKFLQNGKQLSLEI